MKPVTAKCGEIRVHHWAHTRNRMCDRWWEPETEWHRNWKHNFPDDWQEVFLPDVETGEKHIADIFTSQGIVIEFQHSHINPKERTSRERFYKHLTWVVDGTRLKRDYPRFLKGKETFKIISKGIFRVDYPEEYLLSNWLDSSVPVIFDFRGNDIKSDQSDMQNVLFCLFPLRIGSSAIIAEISRKAFINRIISGEWSRRINDYLNKLNQVKQERKEQIAKIERHSANLVFEKFARTKRHGRRRRF